MNLLSKPLSAAAAITLTSFLGGCSDNTDTASPKAPSDPQAGFSQPIAPAPAPAPSLESLPPALQEIVQEGQEAQMKLQELSAKLGTVQEKAMEVTRVTELRDALEAAAEAAILKDAPDSKALLDRLPKLVELLQGNEEINAGNPAAFSDETKQMIEEYETLSAKLQPLQAKAAALPEIETAREELFKVLHEESVKLDPEFEAMEKEYESLNAQLQEMQQAFMAAQQQAQAPADTATPAIPSSITTQISEAVEDISAPAVPTGGSTE